MIKEQKGITLIALVITVIVLLILAGVSITAAIGDNDKAIISKARESAEQTEIAAKGEDGVVKEILNKIDDTSTTDKFTVTFIDGDNKVLATVTGQNGTTISYPSNAGTPTKTDTANAKYTFANKWATDPEGTNVVSLSSIKSSDRLYAVFDVEILETTKALSGIWKFNDTLDLPSETIYQEITYTVDYEYYDIWVRPTYLTFYNGEIVYSDSWPDESFQIIDFGSTPQEVSDEFYTWFIENATQYVPEGMISFTIDGTTYYAEEYMCWDEWLESDYNTGGFKYLNLNNTSSGGIATGMNFYLATSNDEWIVDSETDEKIYVVYAEIEDGLVLVTQN